MPKIGKCAIRTRVRSNDRSFYASPPRGVGFFGFIINVESKMTKISTSTPEQWAQIDALKQKWVDLHKTPFPDEVIRETAARVFKHLNIPFDQILLADSPVAAIKLSEETAKALDPAYEPTKNNWYLSTWWSSYAGYYEGAAILGVEFDKELLSLFTDWCKHCFFVCGPIPTISRCPIEIHWQDDVLHNVEGPSVEFRDGWGIWTIEGVPVNEQIVMRPETQTIQQIHEETDEEVRRIRIDRFGWDRYLADSNSTLVDERFNERDAQVEKLYKTPFGDKRLFVTDPSTGRKYAMKVDKDVKTCEAGQLFISHGLEAIISHRS